MRAEKRYQPPLFNSLKRLRAAFWRRRAARWLLRIAWLALLVPTVVLAGYLWWDWQVQWYHWVFPMLALILVTILWAARPINLSKMVRRLDGRLGLQTRLVTGFEVSQLPETSPQVDNPVVQRLLQEAVGITAELRRRVRALNRALWLEMQALIAVSAVLSALLMLDALNPRLPTTEPVELPQPWQEPNADEVISPEPMLQPLAIPPEMQAQDTSPQQMQAALQALAEALRDQAVSRAAAEAIERGDLSGAAEELRRLADRLSALSEDARQELGGTMQEAAEQIGEDAPGLSQPLQAGSSALESGNLPQAGQALEQLAEALEAAQQAPPQEAAQAPAEENPEDNQDNPAAGNPAEQAPQEQQSQPAEPDQAGGGGAGDGDGGSSDRPTEEERLAVEGQPLELESDPELEERVLQPSELNAQAGDERTSDSPFARQPLNTSTGELGPDPLTYPWDKREVIRSYFTPR